MSSIAGGRLPATRRSFRPGFLSASVLLAGLLVAGSWYYLLAGQGARLGDLFAPATAEHALRFLRGFVGLAEDGTAARTRAGEDLVPAYMQAERWADMGRLALETLAMSVLAIAIAAGGMLLTVLGAARTAATGELLLGRASPGGYALFYGTRTLYAVCRSLPELIWAMFLVFVFAPGILPGALALGLHNLGILGKLCAEVVEDLDRRPIRSLRTSGAGRAQVLIYGVLPQVLPQFLTYVLYRWEVIIRTTIVVGFVGAGGLGREFRLAMSYFHLTDIALILLTYLLLVFAVDLLSTALRRLAA